MSWNGFWYSSFPCSHIFEHIIIDNFCFLLGRPIESISVTCLKHIPFGYILFESSIWLYLFDLIPIVYIFSANLETVGVFKEIKWTSCLNKIRFLFHCAELCQFQNSAILKNFLSFLFNFIFHLAVFPLFLLENGIIISEILSSAYTHLFCISVWFWNARYLFEHFYRFYINIIFILFLILSLKWN